MRTIHIVFGEMGGGKNYWGERIAERLDATFLDGDTLLTDEMATRVAAFKPISKDLIDDFVHYELGPVLDLREEENLVVAQALYLNEHRLYLKNLLEGSGHRVVFWWIKTPFLQNLKQIRSRPNGFRWSLYWLLSKPFFQKPTHQHHII